MNHQFYLVGESVIMNLTWESSYLQRKIDSLYLYMEKRKWYIDTRLSPFCACFYHILLFNSACPGSTEACDLQWHVSFCLYLPIKSQKYHRNITAILVCETVIFLKVQNGQNWSEPNSPAPWQQKPAERTQCKWHNIIFPRSPITVFSSLFNQYDIFWVYTRVELLWLYLDCSIGPSCWVSLKTPVLKV